MRTRKELEEQQAANVESSTLIEAVSAQILLIHTEVLLDIRELLMNPPIEISGTPIGIEGIFHATDSYTPSLTPVSEKGEECCELCRCGMEAIKDRHCHDSECNCHM